MVDDRDPIHAAERTRVGAMAAPRRNIELKAFDPDPGALAGRSRSASGRATAA